MKKVSKQSTLYKYETLVGNWEEMIAEKGESWRRVL